MMSKKIYILLGHPDYEGMCRSIADTYEQAARDAGHTVERQNIGDMQFDPILHRGYRAMQELEPDLKRFQELVKWADHVVIIHPVWWTGMPALLKGLFDRAWLPGSAFRYIKLKTGKNSLMWHGLYKGRTARIIITSGTPPWMLRLLPGNVTAQLKWGILWFAGFATRATWFGPAEGRSPECKAKWLKKVARLGTKGA